MHAIGEGAAGLHGELKIEERLEGRVALRGHVKELTRVAAFVLVLFELGLEPSVELEAEVGFLPEQVGDPPGIGGAPGDFTVVRASPCGVSSSSRRVGACLRRDERGIGGDHDAEREWEPEKKEVAGGAPKLENGGMIDLAFERSRGGIYERPKTLQPYVASGFPSIGTIRMRARRRA